MVSPDAKFFFHHRSPLVAFPPRPFPLRSSFIIENAGPIDQTCFVVVMASTIETLYATKNTTLQCPWNLRPEANLRAKKFTREQKYNRSVDGERREVVDGDESKERPEERKRQGRATRSRMPITAANVRVCVSRCGTNARNRVAENR